MCGRTSLYAPAWLVGERFGVSVPEAYEPRYNIAPTEDLWTVRDAEPETLTPLRWGLVPHWADDPEIGNRLINARAETVHEKPAFRDAFEKRRCLVVVDGFYEWQGRRGSKQPYRVARSDGDPFAMAGLWERWEGDGETLATCVILTTDANETVEPIHDRMPVILDEDEETPWLERDEAGARELLDPYADDPLETYPISTKVNDPGFEDPAVVEPVDDPQTGIGEFG